MPIFGSLGRTKSVAALEWADGALRLSVPARSGRMTATFPLTAPPEEQAFEVSQRVQELARRGVLGAPVCVVLPSHACTFKLVRLPAGSGESTDATWRTEAVNQLGLPAQEVELAFYEQPDGVLVAACRKSFLHTYLAPFVQTGLTVRWVVPSVLGLWASVAAPPPESWGLIELRGTAERWSAVTLAFGKGRHLRLVHPVPLNGHGAEWLTDELQRAVALYHRSFGEPLTRLFVVGNGALVSDLSAPLTRALQLPMEDLPLSADGNTTAERVLSTIANAITALPASASFPPPQPEPALAWRRLEERLIGAGAVLVVVGLVTAIMLSSRVRTLQTQVAQKQAEIAQLERTLNRLTAGAYAAKVQAMEQLWQQVTDPRNDPLEALYAISKALPASVWVTEMAFLRDGQIVLRGSALSHGAVADAARALSAAAVADNRPLFVEVQTNFANARVEGNKTFVDFQITGWLRQRNLRGQRQVQRP